MVTYSSNIGLNVPAVFGDVGTWAPELNATINALDTKLGGYTTLAGSVYGMFATLSASQAQNNIIELTGQPSGDFTMTFTAAAYALGKFSVVNNSTGFWLICQSSIGSSAPTVTVPAGQQMQIFSWGNGITTDGMKSAVNITGLNPLTSAAFRFNAFVGLRVFPYYFSVTDYVILGDPSTTGNVTVDFYHGSFNTYSTGAMVLENSVVLNSSTSKFKNGAYTAFYQPGDVLALHLTTAGVTLNPRTISAQLNGVRYQGN